MLRSFRPFVLTVFLLAAAAVAGGSELGDRLDRELKGAWGVLEVEVYSACSGTYSNNEVGGSGVASKAPRRFNPGELVKLDKVKVKRSRVDLLMTRIEPVLVLRVDGPFELYDERHCQVQLIFNVPREVIKTGDVETVLELVRSAFTIHPSPEAARDSDDWNGREREPFPAVYEMTVARYAVWKAEEANIAIAARAAQALAEATNIVDHIDRDADYLDGLAAGVERMRSVTLGDCGVLVTARVSTYDRNPPSDQSSRWKDGYRDGQRLLFDLMLAERLKHCQVPVPRLP